jgi:superfamily I DNA and RNA helicase
MAQIYRAKGNEAPVVYAVDAQRTVAPFNEVTRRNTLFTAITRSRAWVRITGWGDGMDTLAAEIRTVVQEKYQLRFKVPTTEELATIRHIHRERPREVEATVKRTSKVLDEFLEDVERLEDARRRQADGAND